MRKIIVCMTLIFMLIFSGCSAPLTDKEIKTASSVEITSYDNGTVFEVYTVSEENEASDICETFSSLSAKKLSYHKPAVIQYSISFLNDAGDEIQSFNFLFGNTVTTNSGEIYAITDKVNMIEYVEDIISKINQD